jgi:hypothetical protein
MKHFIYILAFLMCSCNGSNKSKEYTFSSIGWTINVPYEFEIIDQKNLKEHNRKGRKLVQDAYETDADMMEQNTLIGFRKGEKNVFVCTTVPFDTVEDGSWTEHQQFLKEVMTKTLEKSTQSKHNVVIDTLSSTEVIDGLQFEKFTLSMNVPGKELINMHLLNILRNGYDVGITLVYQKEKLGRQFYDILRTSRFSQNFR